MRKFVSQKLQRVSPCRVFKTLDESDSVWPLTPSRATAQGPVVEETDLKMLHLLTVTCTSHVPVDWELQQKFCVLFEDSRGRNRVLIETDFPWVAFNLTLILFVRLSVSFSLDPKQLILDFISTFNQSVFFTSPDNLVVSDVIVPVRQRSLIQTRVGDFEGINSWLIVEKTTEHKEQVFA